MTCNRLPSVEFDEAFRRLTGNAPFPWQCSLYNEWFLHGKIPSGCDIPTGLGKTSVIAVWLIALANGANLPRRLVYIVNRRTVVDQTTTEVEKLRAKIVESELDVGLRALCGVPLPDKEPPLAISTLRGQFADNREWSADPSRPAVICGTVDMIGSRLLFSGYGVGFKGRPLHAGFLGQDVLYAHDEAHLEPAFQHLLTAIKKEQGRCRDCSPFHVMELSATSRGEDSSVQEAIFRLTDEERSPPKLLPDDPTEPIHCAWHRLRATKSLALHRIEDEKKELADKIAQLAIEHTVSGSAVLIFVRTLDDVKKVYEKLTAKGSGIDANHVQTLTGTMRGWERDRMADPRRSDASPVFARFLKPPRKDAPEEEQWRIEPIGSAVYLICTSAGEVGVNLSADHMACDLSTFESMTQRFGRVNRFGNRKDTRIDVVYPATFDDKHPLTPARRATKELLERLNCDASPLTLSNLDAKQRQGAFAPKPMILPATETLFDAWALTSIRGKMPGRPEVADYLHGIAEWEPPRTRVAWREEVNLVVGDRLERYEPIDLLDEYALLPRELLSDASERVLRELDAMRDRLLGAVYPVWLVNDSGEVEVLTLEKLLSVDKKQATARIKDRTLLLPPSAGGLSSSGILDGASPHAYDVADKSNGDDDDRIRVLSDDAGYDTKTKGMRRVLSVELDLGGEGDEPRAWDWFKRRPLEGGRTAQRPVRWDVHVKDVVDHCDFILGRLKLPTDIKQAIHIAARLHDHGKRREQFQFGLGNRNYPERVLAKSGGAAVRFPETYRHEFGSIIDAAEEAEFQALTTELQDLVLHLIAAHHGRARPHFPLDEAYDPDHRPIISDAVATEVPRRFARLQRRYGRWGLAYLESLLRAADWAASAEPSEFESQSERQMQEVAP
ncbi:MAG: type I-U CRISPR-associated helicase/endonuclease Cas3 [Planctomycetia bacterium]|nr:type I-U CRISPR-associated helicase/endonuclease Cas3 [Planctomycetia bacterium]